MSTNIRQQQVVLNHLKNNPSITSIVAFDRYGITRLSAVIFSLRKKGYVIIAERVKTVNRYGNTVYFAEYKLDMDSVARVEESKSSSNI